MKRLLTYVSLLSMAFFHSALCAFYDCQGELGGLKSDLDGLTKIKKAHLEDKMKFSSECLEILLKKNFFVSSEYLMNDYYPKTSIDTEVIVRNVAADVKRSQDHLIFQILKRERQNQFPVQRPVVYWAQSPAEIFIQIKLHTVLDTPECKESFEREVVIDEDRVRVQAYCYNSETDVSLYDSEDLELRPKILPEESTFEWRGDGKVILTLKKAEAPAYSKYLLRDAVREAKELQTWWEMRDRYIELLEDYMIEEGEGKKKRAKSEEL